MFSMNRSTFAPVAVATLASMLAMPSTAQGQQAVQWRVEDGGNGHWYQMLPPFNPPMTIEGAFLFAESLGAHAATITTAAENAFCCGVANGQIVLIGIRKEEGNNVSAWITGEPWTYNGWWTDAPWWNGEGNSAGERWGLLQPSWPNCSWQDIGNATPEPYRMLLEYEADCDSDGIVDYGQILDGTREDTNSNGVPDCCEGIGSCEPCRSDLNNDDRTDAADISVLLGFWGLTGKSVLGDIDGNGQVDAADLSALLAGWGKCP